MRILGIDPGLRTTGYGAIESLAGAGGRGALTAVAPVRLLEAGIVRPDATLPLEARLGALHREVQAVILATRPDVMVVEELWSAYDHPATAVLMGHARGAIYLAAHLCGVPVRALAHAYVKRVLTGSGAAKKLQVKRAVMQHLALVTVPEPDDVSDALALAIAHANLARTELRVVGA